MGLVARFSCGVVLAAALVAACTNDYSDFEFTDTGGGGGGINVGGTKAGGGGGGGTGGLNVGGGGTGGLNVGGGGTGGLNIGGGGSGGTNPGGGGTVAGGGTSGGGGTTCGTGQKLCSGGCVADNNPTTGCAGPSCDPCTFANATAQCFQGQCALASCGSGFGNCDKNGGNGCEQTLTTTSHCGACDRACSTTNSLGAVCAAAACKHTCSSGWGDCNQPTVGSDNGCETNVATEKTHCGSCANNCGAQGFSGGFVCTGGICGCSGNSQCLGAGTSGSCTTSTGRCTCGSTTCQAGEACVKKGSSSLCACNGGNACAAGQTCCQTPAGCFNLQSNTSNCGACGHACAAGQACLNGACVSPSDGGTDSAVDSGSDAADAGADADASTD